jgi:DNA-binding transcriptional LysR family regulator
MNLEKELGVGLLLREKGNVTMTEFGERLLLYCEVRQELESELLANLKGQNNVLMGELRIGGYSTIMRSKVIPSLQRLLHESPGIQVEFMTREV